jgi:hypothetical protein
MVVGICLLSACGGGSTGARPDLLSQPYHPNPVQNTDDPDTANESGSDILTTLTALGSGHYDLLVVNDSPLGSINGFSWTPPPDLRVNAVSGSSSGHCALAKGVITCQATLVAPKCTCEPGGSVTVHFNGVIPGAYRRQIGATRPGFTYGSVMVESLTPVPYVIPSFLSQSSAAIADLPFCKPRQHNSSAHRCIETG